MVLLAGRNENVGLFEDFRFSLISLPTQILIGLTKKISSHVE